MIFALLFSLFIVITRGIEQSCVVINTINLRVDGNSRTYNGSVKIGATVSNNITDVFFQAGNEIRNSYAMFIRNRNVESHGVRVRHGDFYLELTYVEDYSDPVYVKSTYKHFVKDLHLNYTFSPYSTYLSDTAIYETEAYKVLLRSNLSTNLVLS